MAATEIPRAEKGGHAGLVWVCAVCGRHTAPGAAATTISDSACVGWAVLCYPQSADDKALGKWRAADNGDPIEAATGIPGAVFTIAEPYRVQQAER